MKALIFVSLFPAILSGQFAAGLATTDDGNQVYFSASDRQTGTNQPWSPKIFRYTGIRFELYQKTPVNANPSSSIVFDGVGTAGVSGDGMTVGFNSYGICGVRSDCGGGSSYQAEQGEVDIAGVPKLVTVGRVQVSGGGRYVVRFGRAAIFDIPPSLVDLSTGTETVLPLLPLGDVADDGTVLLRGNILQGDGLWLWKAGVLTSIGLSNSSFGARLSRNGRVVLFQTQSGDLRTFDITTSTEVLLAHIDYFDSFSLCLSNDGLHTAYVALADNNTKQLFYRNTDRSGLLQLTHESDGVSSGVISGLANVAYAVTNSGHLLRIKLPGGESDDLTGPTPQIRSFTNGTAPGGLVIIQGINLIQASVFLNDVPVSTVASNPSQLAIQLSYQAAFDQNVQLSIRGGGAIFETGVTLPFKKVYPLFFSNYLLGTSYAIAAHSDFHGLITAADPAMPGELVHLYMTGLGAVAPAIADGTATPLDQLHRTVIPFKLTFDPYGLSLDGPILFSGLAPGFIGVYQIDVQIPDQVKGPQLSFSIYAGLPEGSTPGASATLWLKSSQ